MRQNQPRHRRRHGASLATLDRLPIGERAIIAAVRGEGALRDRLLDMGLTPGTQVMMRKVAPMGDPMELHLRGYELTLRGSDAQHIDIEREEHGYRTGRESELRENDAVQSADRHEPARRKFPGVTVERKDGVIRGHKDATVVDLPGIYSLSPYTSEELITREFITNQHPDAIVNIVDATNIERNHYLSIQLLEMGVPMVIALNMMDEVRKNGGAIRVDAMQQELGVPIVPISASRNEGIDELIRVTMKTAASKQRPRRQDFCTGATHRTVHAVAHLIEDHAERAGVSPRFAATKVVEGDEPMMKSLALSEQETASIDSSIREMEDALSTDRKAAIADMRYSFIEKLCRDTVVKPKENIQHARSVRIDNVLTNKYLALPVFLLIMALVFWLTFGVIGSFLSDLLAAASTPRPPRCAMR
jgi:ferrous iron transport protein B